MQIFQNQNRIDVKLKNLIAPSDPKEYRTSTKPIPTFRFVDVFNAVDNLAGSEAGGQRIDSYADESLNNLLHIERPAWSDRKIARPERIAWPIGPTEKKILPIDQFWATPTSNGSALVILRMFYSKEYDTTHLEIAAPDQSVCDEIHEKVVQESIANSIYRNQTLHLDFKAGSRDQFGDVEKAEQFRVAFKGIDPIADEDLIVDEEIREVLLRNVVDLHERREVLKSVGVPVRRGVLMYGPPGTGKTYACRYLCGKLTQSTKIIVTGSTMLQVGRVFKLARMLQPSVLFFEDVDLVFMNREINLYSSVLGELLDHMDGLRPFEDIGFVMTTNAIDRIESAVRDRPGRISQCVHFAAPGRELRHRYLKHYLDRYNTDEVDFETVVDDSKGATQAFLKEWVHRSVQIASLRLDGGPDSLRLKTSDFQISLKEMRSYADESAEKIIGFRS